MRKQFLDNGLIIPILLGVFSMVGICVVLFAVQYGNERPLAPAPSTETPFRYVYLGTEPNILEPTLEETETPSFTDTPFEFNTPRPIPSTQKVSTLLTTNTPSRTPTLISTATPGVSVYDDADFRLVYSGSWDAQDNISGVYNNTLHISSTVGDSVTFNFIGRQVVVAYQAGPSLGTVTITLDGLGFSLKQTSNSTVSRTWTSGELVQGTHTVVIAHNEGGSINIDSVTIPDLPTPTPTPTSTP